MTRVFIYEFVTGGGWHSVTPPHDDGEASSLPPESLPPESLPPELLPPESLRREGRAMWEAVVRDFADLPGIQVVTLVDARWTADRTAFADSKNVALRLVHSAVEERQLVEAVAAAADWTLLIAPEFDDLLRARAEWCELAGGRLLGSSPALIALCGDKQATAELLRAAGIATPPGVLLTAADAQLAEPPETLFPAVLKPNDGAGSQDIQWIANRREFERFWGERSAARDSNRAIGPIRAAHARSPSDAVAHPSEAAAPAAEQPDVTSACKPSWRLERFCPGHAASVAFLCGPTQQVSLAPCWQRLSGDGHFHYLGGAAPLPPDLAARATSVARRAIEALPQPRGYLGVDLVLGDDPHGGADFVIEINPRLTTSYVGLRALAETNLARAMLGATQHEPVAVTFRTARVQFDACGVSTLSLAQSETLSTPSEPGLEPCPGWHSTSAAQT
ncbi:MAG TPA: ATP-grasp domain-containing protein [Pirellulales bacterium]|jgi:hypothetical protein|nr:ATP-grasp domain-containing protein [Pirellulales bacterium]